MTEAGAGIAQIRVPRADQPWAVQLLRLTARNGFDQCVAAPEILKHEDADDGGDRIPDHDLVLAGFLVMGCYQVAIAGP